MNTPKQIILHVWQFLFSICKYLFWIIFGCIAFLQIMIFSQMWEDLQHSANMVKTAMFIYVISFICFVASLFTKNKYCRYILAVNIIVLFLYFSTLTDLSPYFGYFNMTD